VKRLEIEWDNTQFKHFNSKIKRAKEYTKKD